MMHLIHAGRFGSIAGQLKLPEYRPEDHQKQVKKIELQMRRIEI